MCSLASINITNDCFKRQLINIKTYLFRYWPAVWPNNNIDFES